jgi:hypothetical protein
VMFNQSFTNEIESLNMEARSLWFVWLEKIGGNCFLCEKISTLQNILPLCFFNRLINIK